MKKSFLAKFSLVSCFALLAQQAIAEEVYLTLFLGQVPITGAEVNINGELVGTTNQNGALEYFADPGDFDVVVGSGNQAVAQFAFSLIENENIDIKIETRADADPVIELDKYQTGDKTGPVGLLVGSVVNRSGEPVEGALVEVQDQDLSVNTDVNGQFELNIPRGAHFIDITHPDEGKALSNDVRIVAGTGVEVEFRIRPAVDLGLDTPQFATNENIEEVVVLGKSYNLNAIDVVGIERENVAIVDAIDQVQIERYGDSDVAAVVKRVVGVTVREGKFAVIRGLEGRYLSTTLNRALLPSTDATRREVELDVFPSDILSSIEIQKGFTSDLPGDSAAGAILINTRGIPEERVAKISVSGKFTQDTTGENVLNYNSGDFDGLGFDDGFRNIIPNGFDIANAAAAGDQNAFEGLDPGVRLGSALSLPNVLTAREENALPGFSISGSYGDRYELEGGDFGYYATVAYGQDTSQRLDAFEIDGNGSSTGDIINAQRAEIDIDVSAYLVAGWETDAYSITSRSTFLRQTTDRASVENQLDLDNSQAVEQTILEFTEREFFSQQFNGEHFFGGGHELRWMVNGARTQRYQPDRRLITRLGTFEADQQDGLLDGSIAVTDLELALINPTGTERRWNDLTDEALGLSVDYQTSVDFSDLVATTFKGGLLYNDISREAELARIFQAFDATFINNNVNTGLGPIELQSPEVIFAPEILAIFRENGEFAADIQFATEPTGSYDADVEVFAAYAAADTGIGERFDVNVGARFEDYSQGVVFPNSPVSNSEDLEVDEILPFLSLAYRPSENWQIRLGYARTLSYPGLTERSASLTFDFQTDNQVIGNPNLANSEIDSFDARVEYYFGANSSISLAGFFKQIDDPIEKIVNASQSAAGLVTPVSGSVDQFSFINSESADVYGLEIDANVTIFDGAVWDGFVAGNLAVTESEVSLAEGGGVILIDSDNDGVIDSAAGAGDIEGRDLQGLSPLVFNLQFGVDHIASQQKLTLLLNYFDDRIERTRTGLSVPIGSPADAAPLNSPIFESGRVELSLNYEKTFNFGGTVSVTLGNLLDPDIEFVGTAEGSGAVNFIQSYRRGRTIGIGYSHSF